MEIESMIAWKQMQVSYQVNVAMMKKVMDISTDQSNVMLQMLETNRRMIEQSVRPHLGIHIDLRV